MKKLLLLAFALTFAAGTARAQGTPTVVVDTAHYFFNKQYFKTGVALSSTAFPFYKSSHATTTLVTHIGSKFENQEPIEISGLEAFLSRHGSSTNLTIPVKLYLATLDNNGLPNASTGSSTIIDSVAVSVAGSKETFTSYFGGKFKTKQGNDTSYLLNGNFAVLLRNMSTSAGDTVRVARTAGKTHTNTSAPQIDKLSDGFGFVRYNGVFRSTTDFTGSGFGVGTDYEFCIAPRVQYTLSANHEVDPAVTQPYVCVWTTMKFTSLSSKRFMNRQFNLVEFSRRWNNNPKFEPATLQLNSQNVFPADSSIGWYFAVEDVFPFDSRKFLPWTTTNNQIEFHTDSALRTADGQNDSTKCFTTNEYRTRFKTMAIYGRGQYLQYDDTFIICTSYCGTLGMREPAGFPGMKVFPNPSSGKAVISGISAEAEIKIYDLLGQLLQTARSGGTRVELDISQYPRGTYLIRVSDAQQSRTIRFIRD